ncbi:MAG: nitrite reductase large subunit NirB [Actinomycetota bacterium]
MHPSAQRVVVVGNGMVGQRFVDQLLDRQAAVGIDHTITAIGAEPLPAYDRVALSSYVDGASAEDLLLADPDELRARGVDLRLGATVTTIDRPARLVALEDGTSVPYDHLVLATGSDPFVPPIPGHDRPGCFVYRTLADLDAIQAWVTDRSCRVGVVIGGGLLGLEAANSLRHLGLDTHVVEMADRLMPQQLDEPAAAMLGRWIDELGVQCHLGFATSRIAGAVADDGDDAPVGRLLGPDGISVPADVVVFSAGIRPRQELAAAAGLDIAERGGVVVDDRCLTTDPAISAIGEVAAHRGTVYGLVGPGYAMAATVAARLTGGDEPFTGADTSTKLKLLGVDVASFGTPGPDDDRLEFSDPLSRVHRRVSVRGGTVTGGVLIGDLSNYDVLHAMATGTMASADVSQFLLPADLAGAVTEVELPDAAQLCSCNGVTRGACRQAVADGAHTIGTLRSATTAGSGCGGCVPDLQKLLTGELSTLGIEADRSLCPHFAYSRQELFDLIRLHRHRSWRQVLDAHGSGRGCEICRPTVASILASLSNGHILDGDQATVQDTNDHSLANMQRNGTYSVVPRVPGGEITPEQLIALGEIARDFDLYTKITGAQRVDLFGAQLHELPVIWQRVIDAGMESGHAYGKALRTVKSCVGDTWCRYGVQDSVTMAITIERRYRGLRAPHKLKGAVSGCTRECAEAQSKDFGVIATETGWNLYLCGNGGRTPRHAQLFATDLSDDDLVRYLDRFLMFYVRTADRLERTAPWFEALDGGIDYLRSVIIDDVLGICAELEADMAQHIADYQCEWTATLDDADRLSHFVEFVNAPDQHSTPVWISERAQRVPAR